MNKVLGKLMSKRPVHGRVHGTGTGARWDYYDPNNTEMRKEIRKFKKISLDERLAEVKEKSKQAGRDEVAAQFNAMMPSLMQSMKNWIQNNQQGDFPFPSFDASNSINKEANNAPAIENSPISAPGRENSPDTAPNSSPSICCMPGGGAST
jgi:hypothetical protein